MDATDAVDPDTDTGVPGPVGVDPQEEIYDDCATECVEFESGFAAHSSAAGSAYTSADIEFYGWSYFCKSYDSTPSHLVDIWYVSNNIAS